MNKRLSLIIVLALIAAAIVGSMVYGHVQALDSSGSAGTTQAQNLAPVQRYMDGSRPTPPDVTRVGVVTRTEADMKPWFSFTESQWHGVVYTKADGKLLKLDVWVSQNARGVLERVHVGDYIAIKAENHRPSDTSYSDDQGALTIYVLQSNAVPGLPNDPE